MSGNVIFGGIINTAVIETRDLSKIYGYGENETAAVDKLSLSVGKGEIVGILGPNGSGKTTAMRMLAGIVFPTSGTVSLLGRQPNDLWVKARIGYLPETLQFRSSIRADEFLDFHAQLSGIGKDARSRRIDEVLQTVGLIENAQSRVRTFSKGMLQRIALAQAILHEPQLLFLDEPASALDPAGRRHLRELLLSMQERGATIFINSHQLSEVEMICSRVGIMRRGRLIKIDDLESMLKPVHQVDVKVTGLPASSLAQIKKLAVKVVDKGGGVLTVSLRREENVSELADIIVHSGAGLQEFTPRRQDLESAFLEEIEGVER